MSTENAWPLVRLKDVTVDVQNLDPSRSPETLFTYVDISSIDNKRCQIVSPKRVLGKYAPSRARRPLADEDVLFSNVRTYLRNVAQVRDLAGPALASTGFTLLRPKDELSSRFLYHLVRSDIFIEKVTPEQTGTHYPATSDRVVRDQLIPLPPMPVQEQLACLIDAMETSRSSATDHLEKARNAIDRFRQAVLAAACSGRLTADWREEHPESVLSPGATTQCQPTDPLVETPEEWIWCRLADIADIKGGVQKGAKRKTGDPTREVPYLRVANVQRGWLDLSEIKTIAVPESKIAELRLKPGDILFNEGGDRDKLGRGWVWEGQLEECIHQNHVFRARLRDPQMQPRFYSWYGNTIGSSYFISAGKQTVNLASLSMSTLKALPVPVPSPEEQREIDRRVEQLLKIADGIGQNIQVAGMRIERSTQSVLAKAFRGDLRIDMGTREEDLEDELVPLNQDRR